MVLSVLERGKNRTHERGKVLAFQFRILRDEWMLDRLAVELREQMPPYQINDWLVFDNHCVYFLSAYAVLRPVKLSALTTAWHMPVSSEKTSVVAGRPGTGQSGLGTATIFIEVIETYFDIVSTT